MNFLELIKQKNLIAAHRGASSKAAENTLSALEKSVGFADFIEIDVQLSSDEVLIIMHDDTLERTTNVRELEHFKERVPYNVSDFSFKELESLDYGSWFDSYEPLLTLEIALAFIKREGLFLNIEIKDISSNFSDEKIVIPLLEQIKKFALEEQVLISSFRHEYLLLCKENAPSIATAALVCDEHPKNLVSYLRDLKVDGYNLNKELVDKQTLKRVHEAGFFVGVYTVNEELLASGLFEMGVDAIFSDTLVKSNTKPS